MGHLIHGHSPRGKRSPEHQAWLSMKGRCLRASHRFYGYYGGRGITICERWLHSFENFLADVGSRPSPAHSIDRYPDRDGNYEPGNVRWATRKEQQRNLRWNRLVTAFGETLCISEWAERYGISIGALYGRIVTRGIDPESALTMGGSVRARHVTAFGETRRVFEWAEMYGISKYTLSYRIERMDPETALTTPVRNRRTTTEAA